MHREDFCGGMFLFFWTGREKEKWKISKEEIRVNGDPGAGKFGGSARDWRKQNLEYESRKVKLFGEKRYASSKRRVNSIRNVASGIRGRNSISRIAFCTKLGSKVHIWHVAKFEKIETDVKRWACFPEFCNVNHDKRINHFEIPSLKSSRTREEIDLILKYTRYSASTLPIAICWGLKNGRGGIGGLKKFHPGDGYRLMSDRPFRLMQCKSGYFAGKSFDAIPP